MPQQKKEPDALTRAMGDVLRGLARQQRLTQKQFAELAGIDPTSLQRYLSGTRNITVHDLGLMAAVVGSDVVEVTQKAQAIVDRPGPPSASATG